LSAPVSEALPVEPGTAPRGTMAAVRSELRARRRALEIAQEGSYEARETRPRWITVFYRPHLITAGLKLAGLYERGVRNACAYRVNELTFEFDTLPPSFDGYRILHLSDLHFDGSARVLDRLCETVATIPSDVCVITGDYRYANWGPFGHVVEAMRRLLSAISARHGVFGILGNHDRLDFAGPLERLGVRMLINENATLVEGDDEVWIAGIDDPHSYRCHDFRAALEGIPGNAFRILLAHSPEVYKEAARHGIHLYLCGHTHAGQLCAPGLGAVYLNCRAPRRLCGGPWRYRGLQGYTTSGVGATEAPVRYNCPPEVALIRLGRRRAHFSL